MLGVSLLSCGGTKTLYKTEIALNKPQRIGYAQLAREKVIEEIAAGSVSSYDSVMTHLLSARDIEGLSVRIEDFSSFDDIQVLSIEELCAENQLDGVVITRLKFLNVQYSALFIPVGVSQDTEVEMQFYGSEGDLLLHTLHNTHWGNQYWDFPTSEQTVADGIEGALERLLKEMEQ